MHTSSSYGVAPLRSGAVPRHKPWALRSVLALTHSHKALKPVRGCHCSGAWAGCAAALALWLARWPTAALMQLQPPVLVQMGSYWLLRCALAPVVLLNMSISGILQVHRFRVLGYNRKALEPYFAATIRTRSARVCAAPRWLCFARREDRH